jgi:hypothetical protein
MAELSNTHYIPIADSMSKNTGIVSVEIIMMLNNCPGKYNIVKVPSMMITHVLAFVVLFLTLLWFEEVMFSIVSIRFVCWRTYFMMTRYMPHIANTTHTYATRSTTASDSIIVDISAQPVNICCCS